jgi:hypothetical protein
VTTDRAAPRQKASTAIDCRDIGAALPDNPQSTRMSWRCPACEIPIDHTELEDRPRPRVIYRCHVCRLELVLDRATGKLTVPPILDTDATRQTFRTV